MQSFKINIVINVCCFEAKTRAPSFLPIFESVTTNFQVLQIILRLASDLKAKPCQPPTLSLDKNIFVHPNHTLP